MDRALLRNVTNSISLGAILVASDGVPTAFLALTVVVLRVLAGRRHVAPVQGFRLCPNRSMAGRLGSIRFRARESQSTAAACITCGDPFFKTLPGIVESRSWWPSHACMFRALIAFQLSCPLHACTEHDR